MIVLKFSLKKQVLSFVICSNVERTVRLKVNVQLMYNSYFYSVLLYFILPVVININCYSNLKVIRNSFFLFPSMFVQGFWFRSTIHIAPFLPLII